VQLDWFAAHLAEAPARQDAPAVSIFVMGDNVWRSEDSWPPARARIERIYLHAGRLGAEPPAEDGQFSAFTYDPDDPAPTVGGATFLPGLYVGLHSGQRDQRAVEERPDVLTFTGDPLAGAVELCGPVAVVLHACTDAADTDWTAKLVDVHPDGRARNICDGIVRARYRHPDAPEELIPAGQVAEFRIDLGATSIVLPAGHALRVEISSSNFPQFDAHPNIAGPIAEATAGDAVEAHQQVWHDARRPSHLEVHTVPRR
jgi:hypothetical protein